MAISAQKSPLHPRTSRRASACKWAGSRALAAALSVLPIAAGLASFAALASASPAAAATPVPTAAVGNDPTAVTSDNGSTVYVANSADGTVSLLKAMSCNGDDLTDCGNAYTATVGGTPDGLAFYQSTLYVADAKDNTVLVIANSDCSAEEPSSSVTCTPVATIQLPAGSAPSGMAIDSQTGTLYVADSGSGAVSVVDANTCNDQTFTNCTPVGTADAGTDPVAVAVEPETNTVYVANEGSNDVAIVTGAACDASSQTDCNPIGTSIDSGNGPDALALDTVTGALYIVNGSSGTLSVLQYANCDDSVQTNCTPEATVQVGTQPDGVAVSDDGGTGEGEFGNVYVTNSGSATVSVLSSNICFGGQGEACYEGSVPVQDDTVVSTVDVGSGPAGIAIVGKGGGLSQGSSIYVTDSTSSPGTVSVFGTPSAPTAINAVNDGPGQVTVSWAAPADDGQLPVTSYEVSANAGFCEQSCTLTGTTVPATDTSTLVGGLQGGQSYEFVVVAVSSGGAGAVSNSSNEVTVPATAPCAPSAPSAIAGDASAQISIGPDTCDGGAQITSVTATAEDLTSPVNGGQQATLDVQDGGGNLTVTGLTNGDTYTFTETATNDVGTSSPSPASNSVVPSAPQPTVLEVNPNAGPLSGGTQVTIGGSDFGGGATVDFGSVPATSVRVNSPTTITATSPAEGAGTVDVTVTSSAGTSTTSPLDQFTYEPAPIVTGITPGSGPPAGGTTITISGTGFFGDGCNAGGNPGGGETESCPPPTTVLFGSTPAESFTVNSNTSITAVSPSGTGTVDVTVSTGGGTSAESAAGHFTYGNPPGVSGISPTSGPAGGGTSVTISGAGFAAGATVDFGSTPSTGVTVNSPTSITAVSPGGPAGVVDVTVTTANGTSGVAGADEFTYLAEVLPPTAPGTVTAAQGPTSDPGDGQVVVSWTPAASNGSPVTGYVITPTPSCSSCNGLTAASSATSSTVSGLSPGQSYTFSVAATSLVGNGASASSTSIVPVTVPGAPTDVSALAEAGAALVNFSAPNAYGGVISSYTVTATDLTHSANGGQTASGPASPILVSGLTDGDVYTFSVTATSAVGTGPASAASAVIIPIPTVTSVSGSAFGLESVGLIPISPLPSVTLPSTGGGPLTATAAPIVIPAVLTTGVLNVGTQGSGVGTITGNSSSESQVASVDLLAGALTIGAVTTTCSSSAAGSVGNVTIADLKIAGETTNIPTDVPPNTAITVPGVASVILNAETQVDKPGVETAVTVGGVVINLLGPTETITIAGASCDAEGPAVDEAPSVFGINPNEGPTAGGTSVAITGSGFFNVRGVNFGTTAATSFTVVSPTEITAVSPPGAPGPVDVTVINGFGTSITSPLDVFTYVPAPAISSLNPSAGPTAGGQTVTILGSSLTEGTVTINGNAVTATCTAGSCTFVTPPGSAGPVPVVVTTPGGGSNTLTYTYVPAPTISSINPDAGPASGGQNVTITGTNLSGGTVAVNGTTVTATCTADSCTFVTPPGTAGQVPVTVMTTGGQASAIYTYVTAPAIASLDPNAGPTAGGQTVTISGSDLTGGQVTIGGNSVSASCTADACTFTTPPGAAGTVPVVVTTAGGTSSSLPYTYVAAPALTSLDPNSGPTAGGQTVTISGSDLTSGQVTIGGNPVSALCTADACTFVTPAHAAGAVSVVVTSAGGASNSLPYTYVAAPSISSVSPNSGPTSGGTPVTVRGANLAGATVKIGGTTVTANCSATTCTFVTPAHAAGAVSVEASTAGGSTSGPFTYIGAPSISSVSPSSGPTSGGTHVTVRGANFSGAKVTIGGITVSANCSASTCTFVTPAHVAGAVSVVASTVGGSTHGPFTYVTVTVLPRLIGITPDKGPSYGGTSVVVTGSGFAPGSGKTVITFDGVPATSVTCSSSTSCRAVTPIGLGTVPVQVTANGLHSVISGAPRFSYLAGYYLLSSQGVVYPFGYALDHGSVPPSALNAPATSIAFDPSTHGYWVALRSGKVIDFDTPVLTEAPGHPAPSDIVAITATPDGDGFWLVSGTGKVYPYGDAGYFGEVSTPINKPVLAISPTPDGKGYYLLAGDGGIFTYGDARFYGSTGGMHITSPVVSMAVDRHTGGYWLVAADGMVYAFNAPFLGDMYGKHLNRPMLDIVGVPNGEGYYLVAADGGVFAFGQATFFGSLGNERLSDIVSITFED
jgi:hypothetical protein